jgi:signal transduction histidine kinase
MIADWMIVLGIAAGSALVVAALGLAVLRALRTRSLVLSLTVVALVSVTCVMVGALVAAQSMFLSSHDFGVLLLVCLAAGSVGVAAAVVLSRAVVAGSRALGVAAAGIGDGGYQAVMRPLTGELKQLDAQLAETSARLEASRTRERALEASRRELVAWVSHDLRTPLAGIKAMAEALEDGVIDDEDVVHRYHAGLRREADRLAVMVDDLFELSRINASALHLTLQEVSLADIVSDAMASATPVAHAKGVRLVGGASTDLPIVEGSVPELGRVVRNLLSNAIRHTPADGVVSVRAGADETSADVEVVDACGGIPEQDLPRVFEVAFRGTSARTPGDDGGAGLGLAIAQGLVQAHHGEITIGNHGDGCRVLVRLPSAATAAVEQLA